MGTGTFPDCQRKLMDLWGRAFGDTGRYMDYYFSHKAPRSRIYTDCEGTSLASMAFFTPYEVRFCGEKCESCYIVGVATEEAYRRQHRMAGLLRRGMEACREKGIPFVFLCPETPAVYESLGFVPVYWRETTYVRGSYERGKPDCRVRDWEELAQTEREGIVDFVNTVLAEEKFDLFMERSAGYYDQVSAELKALDGGLYTVWDCRGNAAAVANVTHEEGGWQVTELVAGDSFGKRTVDVLLRHLETDRLQIDDSYFLRDFAGEGIRREKQKKPYLMVRMLSGQGDGTLPRRCYINDIT